MNFYSCEFSYVIINKEIKINGFVGFRSAMPGAMVSGFCVRLTSKRWILKIIQVTMKHDPLMPCKNPCRVYIHPTFTYYVGASNIV
jgi:hypothetical protein